MTQQTQEKLSRINELAAQAANELGLVLLDVRLGQQGKSKSLEVSIYRKAPAISFADCEQMSRSLEQLLEVEETKEATFLGGPYLLEVVSAGIERQLKTPFEFNLFTGSKVRLTTKEKISSLGTQFIGTLLGGDEQAITLTQVLPLTTKQSKNQSKSAIKKQDLVHADDKLIINLQQIYKIYLWPEAKESTEKVQAII